MCNPSVAIAIIALAARISYKHDRADASASRKVCIYSDNLLWAAPFYEWEVCCVSQCSVRDDLVHAIEGRQLPKSKVCKVPKIDFFARSHKKISTGDCWY